MNGRERTAVANATDGGRDAAPSPRPEAQLIHPAAARAGGEMAYGVPVYRMPVEGQVSRRPSRLSVTALVLGLASAVFAWVTVVVPVLGVVFSGLALGHDPRGRAMALTGLLGSALGLVWVLLLYVLPLVRELGTRYLMGSAA